MDAPLDSRVGGLAARTRARLIELGTDRHREALQRFFREPIRAHGVPSSEVRDLARELHREIRDWPSAKRDRLCDALWTGGEIENGALVSYLYGRFAKKLGPSEFALCERWLARRVDNWANCDAVCTLPVAACVANHPELAARVASWIDAKSRWQRRGAAVGLVKEARAGRHLDTILHVAEALGGDPDDMIQKGAGWMLKEAYPKRPGEVVRFLTGRREPFPRLVLRYAAEKMSEADRARVLLR